MDHVRPIRAIFPGARGAIIDVLTRVQRGMTIRQLAERAGVSHPQASRHIADLERLGVVRREHVGRSHVITLSDTMAAQLLRRLTSLREDAIGAMRSAVRSIDPAPVALILFGSFARGDDDAASDIDVLVLVEDAAHEDAIEASLSEWCGRVATLTGNPVAEIVVHRTELDTLSASLRQAIDSDGIALLGEHPLPSPRLRVVAEERPPYWA
jgi:predicted nucleotidyltransferase